MAEIADSLSNQASIDAKEAKTGYGHDMTARQANYRIMVALYFNAVNDLDSAKALAEKFVNCPKNEENNFYLACGVDSLALGLKQDSCIAVSK